MLAYSGAWTAWALVIELAIYVFQDALRWLGVLSKETDKRPTMPLAQLVGLNIYAWLVQNLPLGAVLAWYNPTPDRWTFASNWFSLYEYYIPLLLFQVAANLFWDATYSHFHITFHKHKWLYRHFHKFHHRTDAMLNVLTTGVLDPVDAWLDAGLQMALVAYIGCFCLNSYWFYALTVHSMCVLQISGHSGARVQSNDLGGWLHLLLTPTFITQGIFGNTAADVHHAGHHLNPMSNFSLYLTFWDDLYGTSKPAYIHHPVPLMALDLVYMTSLLMWVMWMLSNIHTAAFIAVAHIITPWRIQALLVSPLSAWVPRLSLWDKLRSAYMISYEAKGTAGAFEQVLSAAAARAPAKAGAAMKSSSRQRYIFCYHPQNIIARGAWYTFAGEMWQVHCKALHCSSTQSTAV
jgi:sterol desaturase/sphingolipid hydroxylase (fatty acid hydroxylase superfamily)